MSKIDSLVQDFLAQKRIAVVGVSDKRDTGCNLGYRKFKEAGYTVYGVNPHLTAFEGDPCYPEKSEVWRSLKLAELRKRRIPPCGRGLSSSSWCEVEIVQGVWTCLACGCIAPGNITEPSSW